MDDIKKKSLREVLSKDGIAPPKKRTPKTEVKETERRVREESREAIRQYEREYTGTSYFFWIVGVLLLLVGGYYLSARLGIVTIKITPRQEVITINGSWKASKNAGATELSFALMQVKDKVEKEVPTQGTQKIETKARGQVAIYNTYSTASQRLVAGTRLATSAGKIFRLDQAVTVPGMTKKGTIVIPGTISVSITADAVGPSYNIAPTTLKLAGFVGTAKYDTIYAKNLKTLSGGESGTKPLVTAETLATVRADLQKELRSNLPLLAKKQIPADFILFASGTTISLSDSLVYPEAGATNAKVLLRAEGSLTTVLFNRGLFARYYASKYQTNYKNEPVDILEPERLNFALTAPSSLSIASTSEISFTLTGSTKLIWPIDIGQLKQKLAGTAVGQKELIFKDYPAIAAAEAIVRPPWIRHFPSDPNRIVISVVGPE